MTEKRGKEILFFFVLLFVVGGFHCILQFPPTIEKHACFEQLETLNCCLMNVKMMCVCGLWLTGDLSLTFTPFNLPKIVTSRHIHATKFEMCIQK